MYIFIYFVFFSFERIHTHTQTDRQTFAFFYGILIATRIAWPPLLVNKSLPLIALAAILYIFRVISQIIYIHTYITTVYFFRLVRQNIPFSFPLAKCHRISFVIVCFFCYIYCFFLLFINEFVSMWCVCVYKKSVWNLSN